jgi:hypothetical protein
MIDKGLVYGYGRCRLVSLVWSGGRSRRMSPVRTLATALQVDVTYYLVHSGSSRDSIKDLAAARDFGKAASVSGVNRVIYLGGLGVLTTIKTPELRHQTGETRIWCTGH